MITTENYLFEKVFFQAAHIAILEEAVATAQRDLKMLGLEHPGLDVTPALAKIDVAYASIEKLKKGQQ